MFKVGLSNESERHQWIKHTLLQLPKGLTLLDAGAGESPYKPFCSHLKYIAQDFGQYTGSGDIGLQEGTWNNSKLDIVSDITSIPLPDQSVDAILCTEVFEHIPDPLAALKEFQRLLKPGGHLITTAPFTSFTHFAPYFFASGFSRFFYEKHLPALGFHIEELVENGSYFEFIAQENRRIKFMAKRYAGRKLNIIEKAIIHLNLYVLQRLSKRDKQSSELLCYGIFVRARKN